MVIDARAAAALLLRRRGQPPQVAPVVVGPQQRDVVRHAHALFVVGLDFFVERPHLRHLLQIGIDGLLQDLPLIGDDLLHQRDIVAGGHRRIVVAPHSQRDHFLIIPVALHAAAPELIDAHRIGGVIPRAIAWLPLLLGAHHRLLVRGAHHNAIFVRQLRVQRIVRNKGVVPHGRPQEIRA